ncbi:MAG: hypothetical protein ACLFP2_05270 [Candidatus Woesearchaeota archaeon]
MYLIATDLDRTLFPNGNQEYDGSMDKFREILILPLSQAGILILYVKVWKNSIHPLLPILLLR